MSALSWGRRFRSERHAASPVGSGQSDGVVLPRLLRRPARLITRLGEGDLTPPRFAATIGSAILIGGFSLYGAIVGGHMPELVAAATARSGFAIDQVKITGHHETSEIDILERLGLDGWTSLVGLNAVQARTAIAALPWVQSAEVRKVYPDTVEIAIVERRPYAIWQRGRDLSIVERSGHIIAPFRGNRHATLPLVLGLGAPEQAPAFLDKVAAYPELASRVKGYIRVGERRWDLRLENGITVRLPEIDEDQALDDLVRMDRDQGLLSRDIATVDMRLEDKLVVKLTPDALMRRNAAVEQAVKDRKKVLREKRA